MVEVARTLGFEAVDFCQSGSDALKHWPSLAFCGDVFISWFLHQRSQHKQFYNQNISASIRLGLITSLSQKQEGVLEQIS